MDDEVREIRSRIDIRDLVGSRVQLRQAGKHWKGLCPFHDDKNPSFYVTPSTGRYRCWSCGAAGDAFNWVMNTQNVDFPEAKRQLAEMAGVQLKKRGRGVDQATVDERTEAMRDALEFFREQLKRSSEAKSYCEKRGLRNETIERWMIGFAPEGDLLAATLRRKGRQLAECRTLYLVEQDASQGYFDRFRGRLMFPIVDERGVLVAFGGRAMGQVEPKYINSGDTPLFKKSRVLYGLHQAKQALFGSRHAVLVEGYLDVIACHEAGQTTAVASLGTSLTDEHGELLKRWCDRVTILYDGDAAGQKASLRALEVLAKVGLPAAVASLPAGEDPDSLVKRDGPGGLAKALEKSVSPLEFEVSMLAKSAQSIDRQFWQEVARALAKAPTEIEMDFAIDSLTPLFPPGRSVESLRRGLKRDAMRLRPQAASRVAAASPTDTSIRRDSQLDASEIILLGAVLERETIAEAWSHLQNLELLDPPAAEIARMLIDQFGERPPQGPPVEWLGELPEGVALTRLTDIEMLPTRILPNAQSVADAAEALNARKELREREARKKEGLSDASRAQMLEDLRKRKARNQD